ncbi:YbaB/EbfC family nucleoid-associated protein [Candidatus Bipolaricaulota bacterium]|nr:YbaB/EbfC family nucleoid-associated protein [Candidatus Bipolaricaulota bacterium]MBS3814837.1 YbaB/EbfC family nucleoid-associated protein [Candidatus Bipolaricaulota bacterium]MBS3825878.1 YbaB/EbfC family nucleoid-associated protein [Candidatus Bipolaricaulota bacterium]
MKGFGNINNIMKKAQEMQEELKKKKEELAEKEVEATSGGGMVKVVVNGNEEVIDIKIEKEVIDPDDSEMLEDLILAAVNNAKEKAREIKEEELGDITGGMNLPNIPGL